MPAFVPVGVTATVKNVQNFQNQLGVMTGAIAGISSAITTFAIDAAVAMTKAVARIGKDSIDSAVKFEDSFAGIRKTVETTEEEFANLETAMRDLSKIVPIDVNELNTIAELGGQLGVVDEDTKNVTETLAAFTRTIADLGVSTDLTTDAAATSLARFSNVMGTTTRFGDEAFSRLGSSIVELGNNFAAKESEIVNFGTRIAAAGAIAGLTEGDVFGISAAMSSVGIQAEAGGTAVQKALLAMNKAVISGGEQLDIFAGTAGMSAIDFADLWEKDAGAGFQAFVDGLGESGDDATLILDALELKDQRLIKAFLSLSKAGPLLGKAMTTANAAFKENTSLAEEAEKRYATTKSQLQLLKNTVADVGLTFGQAFLPFMKEAIEIAKPLIESLGEKLPGLLEGFLIPALDTLGIAFSNITGLLSGELSLSDVFPPGIVGFIDGLIVAFGNVKNFVVDVLVPGFDTLVAFFKSEGPGALETLSAVWADVWGFIQGVSGKFVTWFTANLPLIIQTGKTLTDFWTNIAVPALSGAWELIKGIVNLAMDNILSSITLIMQIINGDWEGAWETIKQVAVNTWDNIVDTVKNFIAAIQPLIDAYVTWWLGRWNEGLEKVKVIWNNIKTAVVSVWNTVKEFTTTTWTKITTSTSKAWETIKTTISTFIDGIKQGVKKKMSEVKAVWTGIWENVKLIASTIWTNITTAITTWIAGLSTETESQLTGIKDFWTGIWEGIKGIVAEKIALIKDTINNLLTSLFESMGLDLENMKERWATILSDIVLIATEIWTRIKDAIIERVTLIVTRLGILWAAISTAVSIVWGVIKNTISTAWTNIVTVIDEKILFLQNLLSVAWLAISTVATVVWETIKTVISTVWTSIVTFVTEQVTALKDLLVTVWDVVSTKVTEIWDAISLKVSTAWTAITKVVTDTITALEIAVALIWDAISKKVSDVWDAVVIAVTEKVQEIFDAVTTKIGEIGTWMGEQIETFKQFGIDIIQGFIDGVAEKAGELVESVTGAVEGAIAGAKRLLGMESPSKLFMEIGANTMLGFIGGIDALAPAVQGTMASAMVPRQAVAAAPVNQSQNITINMGENNIASQIDAALFESRVLQVVTEAIG